MTAHLYIGSTLWKTCEIAHPVLFFRADKALVSGPVSLTGWYRHQDASEDGHIVWDMLFKQRHPNGSAFDLMRAESVCFNEALHEEASGIALTPEGRTRS